MSGPQKIHWYARQPGFLIKNNMTGEPESQTLCGYWASPGEWSKSGEEVTCQGCIKSSTSKRTIEKGRLDY